MLNRLSCTRRWLRARLVLHIRYRQLIITEHGAVIMTVGDMDKYVSRTSGVLEANPQMDEANMKAKVIRPFIEHVLDWDFATDVELEFSIRSGSGKNRVDYALMVGETPDVFVEAKGNSKALTDRDKEC